MLQAAGNSGGEKMCVCVCVCFFKFTKLGRFMEYWSMADYLPLLEKQYQQNLSRLLYFLSDTCALLWKQSAYLPISNPFKLKAQKSHCGHLDRDGSWENVS